MMKSKFVTLFLLLLALVVESSAQSLILHYTETTGYNHNTKIVSEAMFDSWSLLNNYTVVSDDDGTEFNSLNNLSQYAVVVFSNTSGGGGLDATQRANFEAYILAGGNYLGIHAAADTYRHSSSNGNNKGNWDWYAENVAGASVQENPNHTNANHNNTMDIQVANHPTLANIPNPWNKTEEYYYWENGYLNSTFTELLQVGQTGNNSYDAPRMTAQFKELSGGGRAFYTSLGHAQSNFTSDVNFQNLIHDALLWLMAGPAPALFIDVSPTPVAVPKVEDGFFLLETALPGQIWQRYDFQGRLIENGELDASGRIRITAEQGVWLYRTWDRRWVHGVH